MRNKTELFDPMQTHYRLKKTHSKHVRCLKDTGGGLLLEDQAQNIIEQIQEEFEFWDDLHAMWSELPNYNPIGVSNATSGSNHTSELFGQSVAPTSSQLQTFMMNNLLLAFALQNTICRHLNAMGGSNIAGPSMPTFNSFTGQEFVPTSTSSPLSGIPALQPGDSSQQGNRFNASLSGNNADYPDFNFNQI
ncbi:MAG: hypothetical protein NXY57DRAFT_965793 [Lentinula lateritia]|uniref:Uncharacterized protein n=1 Tax=Lentinula lateritia TaxID=40482 RepID=A0ABQ8VH33_9AGAR|nr:MAG: hypothetical protein NXY57DRAFT_965793 [Lentinula lateritia]KAJ4494247.1 hypothetical protein C8R41DRAFT_919212 [Lentinula lateritia]